MFFLKSYRKPRELTWLSGILLLFLMLGFGFSGYLLPWDELSFFATKVGTGIAGAVPVVGRFTLRLLRGGDDVTGATLSRFYGLHVAVLPAVTTALVALHLLFVQRQGMACRCPSSKLKPGERLPQMRFFPNLLRDVLAWYWCWLCRGAGGLLSGWTARIRLQSSRREFGPNGTLAITAGLPAMPGVEEQLRVYRVRDRGGTDLVPFLDRRASRGSRAGCSPFWRRSARLSRDVHHHRSLREVGAP